MRDNEQTLEIELLSQWKLEAEFRNILRLFCPSAKKVSQPPPQEKVSF